MPKCSKSIKKYMIPIFAALLFIAAAIIVLFLLSFPKARRDDHKRISSEEYDTVFLSMFPTDNYIEEDYTHYRAQNILKTSYCIPNLRTLQSYLQKIADSGNMITTAYLGVYPEKVSADKLLQMLREYPTIDIHLVLSYPSINYWTGLSDREYDENLQKYRELTDALLDESNISVYLFSQEWLICNPSNYDDVFLTTEDISRKLMLNCDRAHAYVITPDNVDSVFAEFSELLESNRTTPTTYPDWSDYKIVFFGDSVIGNYTDSTSIPGVVSSLTGAKVYNCGYGGNSASIIPDSLINLPGITEAFINKDSSPLPEGTQVLAGVTEYLQDTSDAKQLCFVINYGLNDYFKGAPVSTEDPYNCASYSGALRTAVTSLQKAYPEAQILLMTPNFTSYFSNGEEITSDAGGVLTDYVDSVLAIADEYNVDVLDNYKDLNINSDNHGTYLDDGCHPNESTRYTIGKRIALKFR